MKSEFDINIWRTTLDDDDVVYIHLSPYPAGESVVQGVVSDAYFNAYQVRVACYTNYGETAKSARLYHRSQLYPTREMAIAAADEVIDKRIADLTENKTRLRTKTKILDKLQITKLTEYARGRR